MALYHMLNVAGVAGGISLYNICRILRNRQHAQLQALHKHWNNRRRHAMLLSSSLIVLQDVEESRRQRILAKKFSHAELSPCDTEDHEFDLTTYKDMTLFDEIRDALPSSAETLEKIEEAKQKLSVSLSEFTQRLQNENISQIISDQVNTEVMAETLSETISDTKEVFHTITQRLVKSPEPGKLIQIDPQIENPLINNKITDSSISIELTQDIIDQNKNLHRDTELVPRFKAAVRKFKAEIAADDSGDPPISLVSRKAKERIEDFIRVKRQQVKEKINEKIEIIKSKDISMVGGSKKDEGIMEYITSNVPDCDHQDPELQEIIQESAGTFYNDEFLINDNIVVQDEDALICDGWEKQFQEPGLALWKKPLSDGNPSLYKIFGTFNDISAIEFYNAQINDQYRSKWDKSVSSLYVVDNITNNREVVYWATKFPFPLKDRDYVFERTHYLNEKKQQLELISRSITHKSKPENSKYVRVYKYGSKLAITANHDIHQKGMSYVLTYYDDCGTPIPAQVRDKLASSKIPEFLEKVHEAAVYLGVTGKLYEPYPEKQHKQK